MKLERVIRTWKEVQVDRKINNNNVLEEVKEKRYDKRCKIDKIWCDI